MKRALILGATRCRPYAGDVPGSLLVEPAVDPANLILRHALPGLVRLSSRAIPGSGAGAAPPQYGPHRYGGGVFLHGAIRELRARQPGMMTLIGLAISVAFAYSLAVSAGLLQGMPL
jgi:Cu2+-exporting ATPase